MFSRYSYSSVSELDDEQRGKFIKRHGYEARFHWITVFDHEWDEYIKRLKKSFIDAASDIMFTTNKTLFKRITIDSKNISSDDEMKKIHSENADLVLLCFLLQKKGGVGISSYKFRVLNNIFFVESDLNKALKKKHLETLGGEDAGHVIKGVKKGLYDVLFADCPYISGQYKMLQEYIDNNDELDSISIYLMLLSLKRLVDAKSISLYLPFRAISKAIIFSIEYTKYINNSLVNPWIIVKALATLNRYDICSLENIQAISQHANPDAAAYFLSCLRQVEQRRAEDDVTPKNLLNDQNRKLVCRYVHPKGSGHLNLLAGSLRILTNIGGLNQKTLDVIFKHDNPEELADIFVDILNDKLPKGLQKAEYYINHNNPILLLESLSYAHEKQMLDDQMKDFLLGESEPVKAFAKILEIEERLLSLDIEAYLHHVFELYPIWDALTISNLLDDKVITEVINIDNIILCLSEAISLLWEGNCLTKETLYALFRCDSPHSLAIAVTLLNKLPSHSSKQYITRLLKHSEDSQLLSFATLMFLQHKSGIDDESDLEWVQEGYCERHITILFITKHTGCLTEELKRQLKQKNHNDSMFFNELSDAFMGLAISKHHQELITKENINSLLNHKQSKAFALIIVKLFQADLLNQKNFNLVRRYASGDFSLVFNKIQALWNKAIKAENISEIFNQDVFENCFSSYKFMFFDDLNQNHLVQQAPVASDLVMDSFERMLDEESRDQVEELANEKHLDFF